MPKGKGERATLGKMKRQHPTDPNMFWCPKCQGYKTKREFSGNKSKSFGIANYCRKCSALYSRKRYFDNLAKGIRPRGRKAKVVRQNGTLWWCPKCELFKERNEFYEVNPSKSSPHGITGTCKKCCGETSSAWKHRNKSKAKTYDRVSKGRRHDKIRIENKVWREKNRDHLAAYSRQRRTEKPEHIKGMLQSWQKKVKESLSDVYIIPILKAQGLPITPEMIELKRQQITMKRTLKQFQKEVGVNEPDRANGKGKQRKDEESHEGGVSA
jgi:hypothetical protein